MKTIKKYQAGGALKAIGKGSKQMSSAGKLKAARQSAMKDMGNYSRFEAPSSADLRKGLPFNETNKNVKRTSEQIKASIRRNYKKGGPVAKAKSGKSFPDLNKDGKLSYADILKGRGVIKNGRSLKKARGGASLSPTSANVSKRLGSRLRAGGTLSPMGSNVSRRLASPFKNKKARGGATLSPSGKSTSNRLASNLKMKHGGKTHMKKAMGGYKMMKMGGKCRGGCY